MIHVIRRIEILCLIQCWSLHLHSSSFDLNRLCLKNKMLFGLKQIDFLSLFLPFFFLPLLFTLPQCRTYSPPGLTTQMPVGQMLVEGAKQTVDQNTRQTHKVGPPWIYNQHNGRVTAGDNTGQNTDKGHTLSTRIGIKISEPALNRNRATGFEDRDSTNHATRRTK